MMTLGTQHPHLRCAPVTPVYASKQVIWHHEPERVIGVATESYETGQDTTRAEAAGELQRLLGGIFRRLDGPAAEQLLLAVRAELDARDARAYAAGWQDAMEAAGGERAG